MFQPNLDQKMTAAAEAIQKKTKIQPQVGLVLGSGLGSIAEEVRNPIVIPYSEIPHFYKTTVEGHAGRLILGELNNIPVVILQGRFHRYEGHVMEDVVFPTRAICRLGIHTLILTNAAGAVNTRFRPGDLMMIEDHLNLMGDNPLYGPNLDQLGPRFLDLSEAYSKNCLELFKAVAQEQSIPIHMGVYAGLLGPCYETPAEVRMLRVLGADAVGMSTVPETIAANHLGVKVVGISCITNLSTGLSSVKLSHKEVIENSALGTHKMKRLINQALPRIANPTEEGS